MVGQNKVGVDMNKMKQQGIAAETISLLQNAGINLKTWLRGFDSVEESVKRSVEVISNHPLLPRRVPVHGLLINPETGQLDLVVNGYERIAADE